MTYMAGSIGLLVQDRNTWHSRADQAWGASRVWSNGSSFEQDSATWNSRANQAWGPSRSWSNGESWEAAYNRVLPPASPDHLSASGVYPRQGWNNGRIVVASITLDRSGYWMVTGTSNAVDGSAGTNANNECEFFIGGGSRGVASCSVPSNTNNWQASNVRYGPPAVMELLGAGTVCSVAVRAMDNNGGQRNQTGWIDAFFMPTQGYPH